jgi:hypothetical protein
MRIQLQCMYRSSDGTSSASFKLQARSMVLRSRLHPVVSNNNRKLKPSKKFQVKLNYWLHFISHLYQTFYSNFSHEFIIILPVPLYGCETWSVTLRNEQRLKLNNAVFWDVVPCRSYVNRRFRGIYCLRLQGRTIRERGTSGSRWLVPRSLIFLPWR